MFRVNPNNLSLLVQGPGMEGRRALESLSKEELLSKCKNLLALAQKAKLAKDGELLFTSLCSFVVVLIFHFSFLFHSFRNIITSSCLLGEF
jgi:hypothetical protein